ncbi:MAG TPA: glycoside hydrolase family 2 TIM barrel-domain containing protein, partial [Chloroflexota bacterium]|nr:glycoside hydrolase family 2 TIM barrel-domain containing protein [Chloroflexota bacterium]
VEAREGKLWLNGRPIYLMSALDQGYWPGGLYTAPSDDALRADVAYAKRLGLNGLRKHLKVEDPRFAYWADRLGLLLWCDAPSPVRFTEPARRRLERDVRAMIARDFNHPSIIVWCPYNESWGLELKLGTDPAVQAWIAGLYERLKASTPPAWWCPTPAGVTSGRTWPTSTCTPATASAGARCAPPSPSDRTSPPCCATACSPTATATPASPW